MPTEKIDYTDPLRVGTDKINKAIDDVNTFQKQIDNIVVEGDSSVEAAQARVDEEGDAHSTLKARVDVGFTDVKTQLVNKIEHGEWKRSDIKGSSDSDLININDLDAATRATILNFRTKNLFNKQIVTPNYFVASGTGTLTQSTSYNASGFIDVESGSPYTISTNTQQGAWYNADKQYISGWGTFGNTQTFVAPINAKYMRVTVRHPDLDTLQVEKGANATGYVAFGTLVNPSLTTGGVKREYIADKAVDSTKVDSTTVPIKTVSINLFNKQTVMIGYYVASSGGGLVVNASYNASDFIQVDGLSDYTISTNTQQGAWFDANKQFISGWGTFGNTQTLIAPTNARYMRVTIRTPDLDTLQIEKRSFATRYNPFKLLVKQDELELPKQYKRIFSNTQKIITATPERPVRIKILGDSITHGVGGTGFAQDGDLILSLYNGTQKWNVNTSGHCWANSLRDYLQSKYNCIVKNYGMTGAVVSFLTQGLDLGELIDVNDDIIILQIGTNNRNGNVGQTKEAFRIQLDVLVKRILSMGKEVILMSSIPTSISNETDSKNFHMEDVDNSIMAVAELNNMEYISNYKNFIQYCKDANITVDSLLADGLHPNDAGYDVMFYLICNALGIGTKRDGATW